MATVHVSEELFEQLANAEPGEVIQTGPFMLCLSPDPVEITVKKKFGSCIDAEFEWLGVSLGSFIVDHRKAK